MANVALVFDKGKDGYIEPQVVRDLLALLGRERVLTVLPSSLDWLVKGCGCTVVDDKEAQVYIVYRAGLNWPSMEHIPEGATIVKRDLVSPVNKSKLRQGQGMPGYFTLKPLGRVGRNLTQMYLNRQAPRGRGVVDPSILLLFGNKK